MATLLETLRGLVTPDLLARAASLFGESQGNVSRGVGAAFPALLAGLLAKSSDSGAMGQIMALLSDRSIDPGLARNPTSLLGSSGLSSSPITELGGRFLSALFGSQTGAVEDAVAREAGVKSSTASALLGLAAPLLMSVLGQRVRSDGLNATGLANLLSSQRSDILQAAPSALTSLFGLGALPRGTIRDTHVPPPVRRSGSWLPWAAAAALALAGLWALLRDRAPEQMARTTAETPRQLASASPTDVPEIGSWKKRLPTNVELTVPATGIEKQVVVFIEDPGKGVEPATWFNFDRLLFETGSAKLKPESREQLRNVAEIMKAYPKVKVKIGGYTDNTGDPASNLQLSQDRATAVVNELVVLGVASDRMTAEGYGQQHPVADNATDAGRQQNRRIALRVTDK